MAAIYQTQLQPWEENQSPSPTEERKDPFDKLARARSHSSARAPSSPVSPTNTLHRQLSGDPDQPPPAWKRRSSFVQKEKGAAQGQSQRSPGQSTSPTRSADSGSGAGLTPSSSPTAPTTALPLPATGNANTNAAATSTSPPPGRASRSPSDASSNSRASGLPPPASRRHPHLAMTTSTKSVLPDGLYAHDSPHGSSSSLADPIFSPPNPAFRRGGGGGGGGDRSPASSTRSSFSLAPGEAPYIDMSNPTRDSDERPLTTQMRRMSQLSDNPKYMRSGESFGAQPHYDAYSWPMAPEVDDLMSRSTTSVSSLSRRTSRFGRKKRQSTTDLAAAAAADSRSPSKANSIMISSAHSSSTDLTKGPGLPHNKSYSSLSTRPPSSYYLSQLGPMDGGYAIAASINTPPQQSRSQTHLADEKRRSMADSTNRTSRPPVSRSAGMGRWSLDGGEHYSHSPSGRAHSSGSPQTTASSNLSAPPINSAEASPSGESTLSASTTGLPEGASPPSLAQGTMSHRLEQEHSPAAVAANSVPVNPSPLSQSVIKEAQTPPVTAAEESFALPAPVTATAASAPAGMPGPAPANAPSPAPAPTAIPIPPIPADTEPKLLPKKSKKELAKEAKLAEKKDAMKAAADRAKVLRDEDAKRRAAKEEAKRVEREEKEQRKKEKKGARSGLFGRKDKGKDEETGTISAAATVKEKATEEKSKAAAPSPATAVPAATPTAAVVPPAPQPAQSAPVVAPVVPVPAPVPAPAPRGATPQADRSRSVSESRPPPSMPSSLARSSAAPTGTRAASESSPSQLQKKKLGFFGTLRRRFSGQPVGDAPTQKASAPRQQLDAVARPPSQPSSMVQKTPSQPLPATLDLPKPMQTAATAAPPATPPKLASSDLPPRSTSKATPSSATHIQGSDSLHASPAPAGAAGSSGPGTSPSPVSRHRNSLRGSRPMPRSGSVTSRHSAGSGSPGAQHATAGSFPFSRPVAPALVGGHEGDTASGESSGLSQVPSHFTSSEGTYELGTPMTSEEEMGAGVNALGGQDTIGKAGEALVRQAESDEADAGLPDMRSGMVAAH